MEMGIPMGRREQERRWRRQYILNVAERLFARKGYHQTTMAEISKASEFGMATIYQFFKSKEKIYIAIFNEKLDLLIRFVEEAVKRAKDPVEKIKVILKANFDFFKQHQDFFKLYSMEREAIAVIIKEDLGKGIYKKHHQGIKLVAEVIEEGIKRGYFHPLPPKDVAILFLGMMEEYINTWIKEDVDWEQKLKIITEVFLNGILNRKHQGERNV